MGAHVCACWPRAPTLEHTAEKIIVDYAYCTTLAPRLNENSRTLGVRARIGLRRANCFKLVSMRRPVCTAPHGARWPVHSRMSATLRASGISARHCVVQNGATAKALRGCPTFRGGLIRSSTVAELFFKPATGYGSKAAYRGNKLTKRVWKEMRNTPYVAAGAGCTK